MDDDLEYFISFPTPKPYIDNLNDKFPTKDAAEVISEGDVFIGTEDDQAILDDSDSAASDCDKQIDNYLINSSNSLPYFGGTGGGEPVVLLLGWLGADDKHLAKYSALYTARGCICVRYTAPPAYRFFTNPGSYMAPLATKLVGVIREMHLHTHPIMCHAFSNHGATLYYFLSKALEEDNRTFKHEQDSHIVMKGCIFDSCPAPRRIWSGVFAVYNMIKGSLLLKLVSAFGAWFYLMGWSFMGVFTTIITGKLVAPLPWALVQECRRVPQLFLYSSADKLIKDQDVENFMSEREKLGVAVSKKKWIDSPHVEHYRYYPEEYSRTVFSFLLKCLKEKNTQKNTQVGDEMKEKNTQVGDKADLFLPLQNKSTPDSTQDDQLRY